MSSPSITLFSSSSSRKGKNRKQRSKDKKEKKNASAAPPSDTKTTTTIEEKMQEFEGEEQERNDTRENEDALSDTWSSDNGGDDNDDVSGKERKGKQVATVSQTKSMPSWSSLGVEPWLEEHLHKLQMKLPTVIQEKCIPPIMEGKHVIGMSQTGSGKTAAFALPILQSLAKDIFGIFCLVLTPTRELALQTKTNFEILAGDLPVRVALVVGGLKHDEMAQMLDSKPHIVVGTPAQVEASCRTFGNDDYFKKVRYLVFDEADQLLRSDASLDIGLILKSVNPRRQTLLFSATMDSHVKKLVQMSLRDDPENVFIYDACKLYKTADNLKQQYLFIPSAVKDCYTYALLKKFQEEKAICMVFFSSINNCEIVTRTFQRLGIRCGSLHAAKPQEDRFRVLENFRNRRLTALMLTDVGNRGLDIPSISYVINYDLPLKTKYYVHRVGRTARAGQVGTAISLVSQFDVRRLETIEKTIGLELTEYEDIDEQDTESLMYEVAEERVKAKIAMLDSGFVEDFAHMKNKRERSAKEVSTSKIIYEKQLIEKLKSKIHNRKHNDVSIGANDGDGEQRRENKKTERSSRSSQPTVKEAALGGITLFGKNQKRKRSGMASQSSKKSKKIKKQKV